MTRTQRDNLIFFCGLAVVLTVLAGLVFAKPALFHRAGPPAGSVVFDAASSKFNGSNQANISWDHTVGVASDGVLFVVVSKDANEAVAGSCTYGGQAMALINHETFNGAPAMTLFYLNNPPTGTNTIAFTVDTAARRSGCAISLGGVDATKTYDSSDLTVTASTSLVSSTSINVTSAADQMVLGFLGVNDMSGSAVPGAGQTQAAEAIDPGRIGNAISYEAGAASVTMSEDWSPDTKAYRYWGLAVPVSAPSGDSVPPTITGPNAIESTGTQLTVVFDEPVKVTDVAGLTLTENGGAGPGITGVASGNFSDTVVFSLGAVPVVGSTITFGADGTNTISDLSNNALASVSGVAVVNNYSGGGGASPVYDDFLLYHWDASDAATITETGGAVTGWTDKVGTENFGDPGGSARPTTGSATSPTGKNLISFDGVDDLLSEAFVTKLDQPATLAIVCGYANTTGSLTLFDGAVAGQRWILDNDGGNFDFSAGSSKSVGVAQDANLHTFVFLLDGTTNAYVDGVLTGAELSAGGNSLGGLVLGGNFGGANFAPCVVGEVRLYSREIFPVGLAELNHHLVTKWIGPDTSEPTITAAHVDPEGDNLYLTLSETVTAQTVAGLTLKENGGAGPVIDGIDWGQYSNEIVLSLATPPAEGSTLTLDVDNANTIADLADNNIAAITGVSVTNNRDAAKSNGNYPSRYDLFVQRFNNNITAAGTFWNGPFVAGDTVRAGRSEREPWLGYFHAAEHFNDPTYAGYAAQLCDVLTENSTAYGMPTPESQAYINGDTSGVYAYSEGFEYDWLNNADTSSRDAISAIYANDSFAGGPNLGNVVNADRMRENAYGALVHIVAHVSTGQAYTDKLIAQIKVIINDVGEDFTEANGKSLPLGGHLENILGNYVTDSNGDYVSGAVNFTGGDTNHRPFIGAYAAWSLIRFNREAANLGSHTGGANSPTLTNSADRWIKDEWVGRTINNTTDGSSGTITANTATTITASLTGGSSNLWNTGDNYRIVGRLNSDAIVADSRVVPKLIRLADAEWLNNWNEAELAFKAYSSYKRGSFDPDLNNVVFPYFAWLYLKTGEERFRIRAEKIFNGSVRSFGLTAAWTSQNAKQWNDTIRHAFQGLKIYESAIEAHGP